MQRLDGGVGGGEGVGGESRAVRRRHQPASERNVRAREFGALTVHRSLADLLYWPALSHKVDDIPVALKPH